MNMKIDMNGVSILLGFLIMNNYLENNYSQ